MRIDATDPIQFPRSSGCAPSAFRKASPMEELLRMCGVPADPQAAAAGLPVTVRTVRAGGTLVHEGAPADHVFFVRSGTFKVFHVDEDGYERVLAFAIRGEVLGFDTLCMATYPAGKLALEDSSVFVVPRRNLDALCHDIPSFARAFQQAGSQCLTHSREVVDILAAVGSDVRLARYLIQLSRRMAASGMSPSRFHLRMGRREIASLLGVAHETVSRGFGALAALGLLQVDDREVEILDMTGLRAFARNTRRASEHEPLQRHCLLAGDPVPKHLGRLAA